MEFTNRENAFNIGDEVFAVVKDTRTFTLTVRKGVLASINPPKVRVRESALVSTVYSWPAKDGLDFVWATEDEANQCMNAKIFDGSGWKAAEGGPLC